MDPDPAPDPHPNPTPDPTPFFNDFKDAKNFFIALSCNFPAGIKLIFGKIFSLQALFQFPQHLYEKREGFGSTDGSIPLTNVSLTSTNRLYTEAQVRELSRLYPENSTNCTFMNSASDVD